MTPPSISEATVERLDRLKGPLSRADYLEALLEAVDSDQPARALEVLRRLIEHHAAR